MTIYYPDISGHQGPISLKGALIVAAKVTEGTGYLSPAWDAQKAEAARQDTFLVAYHFLLHGNPAAQAAWAHQHAGPVPLMVDFEPEPQAGSFPTLADCTEFTDAYRKLGGTVHLVYLPRWYWQGAPGQGLGSPSLAPLAQRGMALVSSAYTAYTDAPSGEGWQPYGGMTPAVWQYTDALQFNGQPVDFNAYRGSYAGKQDPASVAATLAEFRSLATTGHLPAPAPPPPSGPFRHVADGTQSLEQIAAARGTTRAHLLDVSMHAYGISLQRAPLAKGTQYWTSNP